MKHLLFLIVLLSTICFNSKAQQSSLLFQAGPFHEFSKYEDANIYDGNTSRGLSGTSFNLSFKRMLNSILGIRLGTNFQKMHIGLLFPYALDSLPIVGTVSSVERIQIPFELIWVKNSKNGKFTLEIGAGVSTGFLLNQSRFETDWDRTDSEILSLANSYGRAFDQKIELKRQVNIGISGKLLIQYNLNPTWGISFSGTFGKGTQNYLKREIRYAYTAQNMHYAKESFSGAYLGVTGGISYTFSKDQNNSVNCPIEN